MNSLENSNIIQNVSNSSTPIQNTTYTKIDRIKIIKNMEEVLKSVKKEEHKKHHLKHKHNKNKKICSKLLNNSNINEIADISNKLDSTSTSPNLIKTKIANSTEKLKSKENRFDMKEKRKKKSKNEYKNETNESPETMNASFTSPKKLITGHFLLTPKKQANADIKPLESKLNDFKGNNIDFDKDSTLDSANATKINAFEFLMNSRNKSIGRNSPGKELIDNEVNCDQTENDEQKKVDNRKRKNLLQELVENKTKTKRKFIELDESRGEYIEQQLNKRAKRLKLLLTDPVKKVGSSSPEMFENENEKPTKQIKTAKRRSKRSNTLHLNSTELFNDKLRTEDAAFVAKLSSPTKKKDNLLGYFSKTISPILQNNEVTVCATETNEIPIENKMPRRRGRPKRMESLTLKKDSNNVPSSPTLSETIQNFEQMSTPTHRPRRSCVGKAKYDYDLEVSPTKLKPTKKTQVETSKEDVIVLDTSNEVASKKLAPLFIKSIPKPYVDPDIIRARQKFLMSGVPDKMKKEMAKQKTFEENFEAAINIFPTISHVPAWQIENINVLDKKLCKIKWFQVHEDNFNISTFNCTKKSSKSSDNYRNLICNDILNNSKLLPITLIETFDNKKQVVKTLKSFYEKFPTYKCYNQLRQKYHFFIGSDTGEDHQQVTESFMVTRRSNRNSSVPSNAEDDVKPPPSAPNGELLFTEKYKALSSEQILVNLSPVNALKEFLSAWQNVNKFNKDETFNDFEDSNSIVASVNSIVLVGPKSSGKTSAVFALANEMNFQVLEINAGMKRTGKRLLQDLQEATQSHQVRKDSNLIKKSLDNTKLKKTTSNENSDSLLDFSSEKMSLVLLEDADIVFEQHDFGFVDAIYQLTATSKRPVVITANNYNCQHLNRLINNNSVYFPAPNPQNISKFISILSLIENCPLALNEILSLYLFNSMDLRKTILEIQFFVQSGGGREVLNKNSSNINSFYAASLKDQISFPLKNGNLQNVIQNYMHSGLFNFYIKSQNVEIRIPIPINYNILRNNLSNIFHLSKNLKDNDNSQCEKSCSGKILDNLVDFYENVSIANYLDEPTEFTDRLRLNIGEEISYYLVENALKENLNAENCSLNLYNEPQEERTTLAKSLFSSGFNYKNKSIALDYEPYLRAICRNEKERLLHDRRGSRFYHYLRNYQTNSFSSNIFDESCKIFLDFESSNQ